MVQQLADFVTQITGSNFLVRIILAAIVVVIVALICHLLVRTIQRLLALESASLSQTSIVVNLVRIVVWGLAICFIADVCFDVNMNAVIAALGVGGIAISLGFQNTLSNLFGGILITMTHVIKPGDNVSVSGNQGVVQDVNWSYTTIHNSNNETVIIPNSVMASNAVTHLPPLEHVSVPIVVQKDLTELDDLTDQVQQTALEVAQEVAKVTKEPVVSFNRVGDFGLYGNIVLEISDGSKASAVSDAITRAVAPLIQKKPTSTVASSTETSSSSETTEASLSGAAISNDPSSHS